ncbi:hypothetical protein ABOM_008856 [Aspergillus bombycis]|uniref:Uncharacterized protein n=1 Tax=Aspergillus bombycis TaxID=109264 RepID=A0A1F7ZUP4_9EURO|nr:hypothetical protein ABOM_008856 [Aspergillus bombycis]OGM43184.1 hypothetical protein ABOM_008856 [Aspergillus bombycis]
MSLVDISWTRSSIAAITNLGLYLFLVQSIPPNWSPLIPVAQIACEPVFHYLAGAEKTPRYNMLVAPLLHASNCFEWGVRQVAWIPRLTVAPPIYLALILVSRLLLDMHLLTVFRHRKDLQWARQHILLPTHTLICYLAAMLLVEHAGIPVVTYIKPIVVIFMDGVGFLPHIIPASYAIAFDQVKIMKS